MCLLDLKFFIFILNRIEWLDFSLGSWKSLLEWRFGCLKESNLSFISNLLLHILLVFGDQVLDFVLKSFRVLDLSLNPIGNLHPWSGVILELVNEEDLININQCLIMITIILLLNLLDQPLKLIVIKQLRNILLNCVHYAVPILTLNHIRIGIFLPNNLNNAVLFIKTFINYEVSHVQVLLPVVLCVDMIKLEDHIK